MYRIFDNFLNSSKYEWGTNAFRIGDNVHRYRSKSHQIQARLIYLSTLTSLTQDFFLTMFSWKTIFIFVSNISKLYHTIDNWSLLYDPSILFHLFRHTRNSHICNICIVQITVSKSKCPDFSSYFIFIAMLQRTLSKC